MPVVEQFNVFENTSVPLLPSVVRLERHPLGFQGVEKRFCDGIVVTAFPMTLLKRINPGK